MASVVLQTTIASKARNLLNLHQVALELRSAGLVQSDTRLDETPPPKLEELLAPHGGRHAQVP